MLNIKFYYKYIMKLEEVIQEKAKNEPFIKLLKCFIKKTNYIQAGILSHLITSKSKEWTQAYISRMMKLDTRTIKKHIDELQKNGYIKYRIGYDEEGKRTTFFKINTNILDLFTEKEDDDLEAVSDTFNETDKGEPTEEKKIQENALKQPKTKAGKKAKAGKTNTSYKAEKCDSNIISKSEDENYTDEEINAIYAEAYGNYYEDINAAFEEEKDFDYSTIENPLNTPYMDAEDEDLPFPTNNTSNSIDEPFEMDDEDLPFPITEQTQHTNTEEKNINQIQNIDMITETETISNYTVETIIEEIESPQTNLVPQKVNFNSLMNAETTVYSTTSSIPLFSNSLNASLRIGERYKTEINKIRQMDDDAEKKELKRKLPMFTVSASFERERSKDRVKEYNNIICIDIDGKDNAGTPLETIKEKVNGLPFVFYSAVSCSGKGVFALVHVDGDIEDFESHFNALQQDFERIGIIIDSKCKDISRTRFISYDNNPHENYNAETYTKKAKVTTIRKPQQTTVTTTPQNKVTDEDLKYITNMKNDADKLKAVVDLVERKHISITKDHQDSLKVRSAIINIAGGEGLDYWLTIREQRSGFDNIKQSAEYFKDIRKGIQTNYGIGTIIHLLKEA